MGAEFAGYLRAEIRQRGWSERELARRAGISISTLHNLLNDERAVPTLDTLRRIATALSVQLGRLVELLGYDIDGPRRRARIIDALTEDDYAILESLSSDELRDVLAFVRRLRGRS
jgi:transcriptional regulator with XRE-family HTH domain